MSEYYLYIMTNESRTLYTGVTDNVDRQVDAHRIKLMPGFPARRGLTKLVYFEPVGTEKEAVARQRQVRRWRKKERIALIESRNPWWEDLSLEVALGKTPKCAQGRGL